MQSTVWLKNCDGRLSCLVSLIVWGILAPLAFAADVVPPRPFPHAPTGGTLTIGYMRETSSPDGFQAVGSFDRMYFFTGNEVLVAIGKDGSTIQPNPWPMPTKCSTPASATASISAKVWNFRVGSER